MSGKRAENGCNWGCLWYFGSLFHVLSDDSLDSYLVRPGSGSCDSLLGDSAGVAENTSFDGVGCCPRHSGTDPSCVWLSYFKE